ncbi:MAG: T9SS type A sorting domain-containing protein [Flavobacteriales bacterium]|nr:T9SS type A sorting domain-containing protein [Flavobacteriales bacterium]
MRSLFLSIAVLSLSASAQITIGPADMPVAGDTVRFQNTAAIGLDPTPTEAGFVWDFSMLTPDIENADTCVAVSSTPLLFQFYFNNPFIYPEYDADFAVRGQGFNFQQLTVSDLYDYFKNDAAGFRNVGFGANVNGVPTSVRRTPIDWVYRFPLNYGDMDTSASAFTLTVPTFFSFTQQQTRYNEVDGWGTLYLPADTFEVLRVKSTLMRTDSIYIEQFGTGFTIPEPESIEYKWLAAGMDEPVLQINTTAGQATTARFYYHPEDIVTAIDPVVSEDVFAFSPNPANDALWIRLPNGTSRVEVIDARGSVVLNVPVASAVINLPLGDIEPGSYVLRVSGAKGVRSERFMVQR